MLRQETIKGIVLQYLKRLPVKVDETILFGSSARGDRLSDSDVDLIVISRDFEKMSFPDRFLILQKSWKSETDLEAFGFTREEFNELKHKSIILQEAAEHGIRIKGRNRRTRAKNAG